MLTPTPITIAGQERRLVYDFRAWRYLKEKTGLDVFATGFDFDRLNDLDFFGHTLLAGLLREHPEVKLEDIDGFTYAESLEIMKAMGAAILTSFPEPTDEDPPKAADEKGQPTPGSTAGPSPSSTSG